MRKHEDKRGFTAFTSRMLYYLDPLDRGMRLQK